MGQLNDIYKVVQKFTVLGIECLIRRWYKQTSSLGDAATLATNFGGLFQADAQNLMSDLVFFGNCEVQNLDDPADFAVQPPFVVNGAIISPLISAFNAVGFECTSTDRRIRSATLRLPAPTESMYEDGVIVPPFDTNAGLLASMLSSDIVAGLDIYEPVIYTPGNAKTFGIPTDVPIAGWFYTRLTTQNSRKS